MTPEQRAASNKRVARWKTANREQSRKQARESAQRMRVANPGKAARVMREWTAANPARKAAIKRRADLKRYGLTESSYAALLLAQGGKCAICRSSDPRTAHNGQFPVDHCHETGRVRGLLCGSCNAGIGMLQHDTGILSASIEYLQNPPAEKIA